MPDANPGPLLQKSGALLLVNMIKISNFPRFEPERKRGNETQDTDHKTAEAEQQRS